MSDTPQVLLAHHLKPLRLPTFLREYDKLARQCAVEGVDHSRYLLRLAELEMIDRERRTVERRIKEARFPAVKSLDSFDFTLRYYSHFLASTSRSYVDLLDVTEKKWQRFGSRCKPRGVRERECRVTSGFFGGPLETRTPDPLIKSQLLYQLS